MGGKWWWFPTKAFSLQPGCFAGSHLCSQVMRRARELENARMRLAMSPGLAWPPKGQETQGYARGRPCQAAPCSATLPMFIPHPGASRRPLGTSLPPLSSEPPHCPSHASRSCCKWEHLEQKRPRRWRRQRQVRSDSVSLRRERRSRSAASPARPALWSWDAGLQPECSWHGAGPPGALGTESCPGSPRRPGRTPGC